MKSMNLSMYLYIFPIEMVIGFFFSSFLTILENNA